MLYNRLGRRQTFAMYRQNIVHEWMIVFAVLRGLACEWASWGAGPDGSVFYYQLFTSNFIFQASKNLTFFPPSILHNFNWLPHPTSPSLNRKTYFVQWSPTWPWFTLFRYLGFLLNWSCLCKTKFVVFKMQNIWITWLRHSWSATKYNNNPVWRQLKKLYNFLLQHRNFDTVRFVIMDITNGRVA